MTSRRVRLPSGESGCLGRGGGGEVTVMRPVNIVDRAGGRCTDRHLERGSAMPKAEVAAVRM